MRQKPNSHLLAPAKTGSISQGLPLTRLLGYTPGWTGLGLDLPKGVFEQWVSWVMSPRYMFDDTKVSALRNFAKYHGALRR